MCTLAISFAPGRLAVAANRDELLGRPARGPFVWPQGFFAPRDEQAGGTWLGLTPGGLFVGVTNRFLAPKHPERESRGALVVEALSQPSALAVHQSLGGLSAARFNAFHLLYADEARCFLTWSDGEVVQQRELGSGVHVVTERSLRSDGVDARGREALVAKAEWTTEGLQKMLAVHHPTDPLQATCVHLPEFNYGTRSSFTLVDGALSWAEGTPCTTAFKSLNPPW